MNWFWNFGLYILLYPVIQIISTIRHEGCHAIAAWFEGATIKEFRVYPKIIELNGQKRFTWGYIRYMYPNNQVRTVWVPIAPYICLPLIIALSSIALLLGEFSYHPWALITIFGITSPFVDFTANYLFRYKRSGCGDFMDVKRDLDNRKANSSKILRVLSTIIWLSTFIGMGIAINTLPL